MVQILQLFSEGETPLEMLRTWSLFIEHRSYEEHKAQNMSLAFRSLYASLFFSDKLGVDLCEVWASSILKMLPSDHICSQLLREYSVRNPCGLVESNSEAVGLGKRRREAEVDNDSTANNFSSSSLAPGGPKLFVHISASVFRFFLLYLSMKIFSLKMLENLHFVSEEVRVCPMVSSFYVGREERRGTLILLPIQLQQMIPLVFLY